MYFCFCGERGRGGGKGQAKVGAELQGGPRVTSSVPVPVVAGGGGGIRWEERRLVRGMGNLREVGRTRWEGREGERGRFPVGSGSSMLTGRQPRLLTGARMDHSNLMRRAHTGGYVPSHIAYASSILPRPTPRNSHLVLLQLTPVIVVRESGGCLALPRYRGGGAVPGYLLGRGEGRAQG